MRGPVGEAQPGGAGRDAATASAPGVRQAIRLEADVDPVTLGRLRERLEAVIERSADRPVVCDLASLRSPDIRAIDALARLQLTARRLGSSICLAHPPEELVELLELVGLLDTFSARPGDEQA